MKLILRTLAACLAGIFLTFNAAQASSYTYVGSWMLGAGPDWATNPAVLSGVETAALLFGGTASDYVISTVDSNVANVNFSTWLDGWNDANTYANNGTPASDTFSYSAFGPGYNDCGGSDITLCTQSAYSAYVNDHFDGTDAAFTNFAFRVSATPLPATLPLFASGLGGLGLLSWRRKKKAKALAA